MKATDLMIGDWVKVSMKQGAKVEYGRVANLDESGGIDVGVTGEPSACWNLDGDDEILPIPLTPEILERNGFCDTYKDHSLAKDNVFKWYDVYGHCVTVDMNANAIKIQHDSRVLLDLRYNIVVPVHELQHALRLCGIDKEIIL